MLRLGFSKEGASYAARYRAATAALRAQGKPTRVWFRSAFHALRAHGLALCKRSAPRCIVCPLSNTCPRTRLKNSY